MILVTSRYSSARRRLLAPDKVRPRVFVPPEGFGVLVSPFVDLVKSREELVEHGPFHAHGMICLLYTSPSPRDLSTSRMPSSA